MKQLVESRTAPSLENRISINSTRNGKSTNGHAWLTLDKDVVANFCTRAFWNRAGKDYRLEKGVWITDAPVPSRVSDSQNERHGEMEYGELSRESAHQACWEYVHELSIEEALASEDPLIQALAVIDGRVGKRRLKAMAGQEFHPLARKLLIVRLKAEGVAYDT